VTSKDMIMLVLEYTKAECTGVGDIDAIVEK
jgi:hypothetical protein